MNRSTIFNAIAIISTLAILGWIATDFYGGMLIYFLSYGLIIIPFIILYVVSFGDTLISLIRRGLKQNEIKVFFHGLVVITVIALNLIQSDLFKSKRILTARLKDDQALYTLILRENGNCENEVDGMFGFHEVYHGKYQFYGDTIVFEKKPYDNDFIPDTLLMDRKAKALFLEKDTTGNFYKTKEWLNHFEIQ